MPPIEMPALRPVLGTERRAPDRAGARIDVSSSPGKSKPAVSAGGMLDPGARPVDAGRVAEFRTAVASGSYAVTPARVADAMIAAGFLRGPK